MPESPSPAAADSKARSPYVTQCPALRGYPLDQSADFQLIPHLQASGHDVTVISRDYPHGLPDEDVLAIAQEEKRILLVADRDFGELIFNQGYPHAGVIFFRLPGAPLQDKTKQLDRVLTQYADALEGCKFLVVTPNRIRVAGLPPLK